MTIAITACIGLFADGEATETIANRVHARQERNRALTVEATKVGTRRFAAGKLHLRKEGRGFLPFGPDENGEVRNEDSNVAGPIEDAGPRAMLRPSQEFAGRPVQAAAQPPVIPPGISANEGAKADFRRHQAPRARPMTKPTGAQLEALLSASRARSGSAGED